MLSPYACTVKGSISSFKSLMSNCFLNKQWGWPFLDPSRAVSIVLPVLVRVTRLGRAVDDNLRYTLPDSLSFRITAKTRRNILSTGRPDSSNGSSITSTCLAGGLLERVGLEVDPREYRATECLGLRLEGPAEDISENITLQVTIWHNFLNGKEKEGFLTGKGSLVNSLQLLYILHDVLSHTKAQGLIAWPRL